ncbi:RDD family protein [Microbacterium sp. 179-B 1A2 NHS]|uniref:RDD family protein n=1 Tax=Microbacterium sp. 179-B 1A2 NHS TaxID=3142383 RepID=UPI00399F08F5
MGRSAAALSHRVSAVAIDLAISVAVTAVASSLVVTLSVLTDGAVPLAALAPTAAGVALGWFVVQTAMQGRSGSLGMRVMGLRLAHADDDDDLGFARALGRNVLWVLTASAVVGLFSPLFDPSSWRRGWHDLASGAVMTDAVPVRPAATAPARIEPALRRSVAPAPIGGATRVPPQPAVIALASAPPRGPVPVRAEKVAAPAAAAPAPASWAPASRAAGAVPRTLPVDVISTVPGVPTRNGIRPKAHPSSAPTLAMLVWDDGTRHTVYEATLFGRSPVAEPGLQAVPVRDETLSISKTHFEIGADERGAWVLDRHSLNGVVVVRSGQPQRIVPGERARLWSGDVLEVGDRRVTVEGAR